MDDVDSMHGGPHHCGSPLYELDPDCLRCIIRLLAPGDACSLAKTCTRLKTLVREVSGCHITSSHATAPHDVAGSDSRVPVQ